MSRAERSPSFLLKQEIAALESKAQSNGVGIEIDPDTESLWISRIDRLSGAPGSGATAIRDLIEIAEEYAMPIGLACQDGFLVEYYAQFGFEIDEEATVGGRDDDMVVMIRNCED